MNISIIALLIFIAVIIVWNVGFKRHIAEAMLAGLVATALCGGTRAPRLFVQGMTDSAMIDTLFASITFVFMAYLIEETGLITRLVAILNSLLGRLPGGAAYVSLAASGTMGTLSGSNSANTATVGSIAVPWMVQSNFSPELAAIVQCGNGGLSAALPPSISMFLILGLAPIGSMVSTGDLYIALFVAGIYQVIHRVIVLLYFVRRYNIKAVAPEFVRPFRETWSAGWTSTLILLGALIPIAVTIGPLAERLAENPSIGASAMRSISLITWIPILIILISFLVGWRALPRSAAEWNSFLERAAPKMSIGAVLVFAFAASEVLSELGLGDDLGRLLSSVDVPQFLMVVVVGIGMTVIAGPLSSVATLTATGVVAFTALISAGVEPVAAAVAILVFASTEAASPPASGSIFIAASLAGAQPEKTFIPLIKFYVLPILAIGCLVALGWLPLP